jgi:hypothetical protein
MEDDIFKPHTLAYQMYDKENHAVLSVPGFEQTILPLCTFQLPKGPYQKLQYAVDSTEHSQNKVLAEQHTCDLTISLHTYEVFASLRAGHRLQLMNILRELKAGSLLLAAPEVRILFTQALWQVGPSDNASEYREAHIDLSEPKFCHALLEVMSTILTTIEDNWTERGTLLILVTLVRRVLSMAPDGTVIEVAADLLRACARTGLAWLQTILTAPTPTEGEDAAASPLLDLALICRSIYDLDDCYIDLMLWDAESIANFAYCASLVHDNTPADIKTLPLATQLLLTADQYLAVRLEARLRLLITGNRSIFDLALSRIWSTFTSSTGWDALEGTKNQWVKSKRVHNGVAAETVHYDLLKGLLLINGIPFGRLPHNYTVHPTFRRLFKEVSVLNIEGFHRTDHHHSGI